MPYLVASRRRLSFGHMGIVPMMTNGGGMVMRLPMQNGSGSVAPIVRSPIVYNPPSTSLPNAPAAVLPTTVWGGAPIVRGPIVYNPPPTPPLNPSTPPAPVNPPTYTPPKLLPVVATANAGTPVPAGYPTSQIFVDPNGGFWQFSASQNQWINVGTPYNTGATAIPPAVPTGSTPSAPTSLTTPTTAPAPVNVSIAAPSSTYQEILDWLQQDTLGSTIGFDSIPNWIVVAAAGALAWKFSQPASRGRNPLRRRRRR
jgi:hypothetical protein